MSALYQHVVWPYALLRPFTELFCWSVRRRKRMSAGRTLPYYAWFYDRYSKAVKDVRFGAGKWPALEALYNWRPARNGIMGKIEAFWMNVRSAQAVRNRKTIVAEEIRQAISSKIESEGEARVLSIACGSAQSVFEAIDGTGNVRVLAIDMDETATFRPLNSSKVLISRLARYLEI